MFSPPGVPSRVHGPDRDLDARKPATESGAESPRRPRREGGAGSRPEAEISQRGARNSRPEVVRNFWYFRSRNLDPDESLGCGERLLIIFLLVMKSKFKIRSEKIIPSKFIQISNTFKISIELFGLCFIIVTNTYFLTIRKSADALR